MTETETSPRQVLYALVAAGFILVVVVLTIGGAAAGVVPTWWSTTLAVAIALAATWMAQNWRNTVPVLLLGIGLFVIWLVGTLILAV